MDSITIEIIDGQELEKCRELCNELMALQKSLAKMHPECFNNMNFDTRMQKSYFAALRTHLAVAFDDGQAIGYVFSTIDNISDLQRKIVPDWAPPMGKGFYPDWLSLPQNIGCLNNLYIREQYQNLGLGQKLLNISLNWLESFADTNITFVFVSNGNDKALNFYQKNNFLFSHDVFGGFITALYKNR